MDSNFNPPLTLQIAFATMSTSAKLVTSQFIKSIPKGGKTISIEWAKQTTAWNRLLCTPELQNEFAAVVEANKSQLPAGTATVAMKSVCWRPS